MAQTKDIDIRQTLSSLIPESWLEQKARELKVVRRKRKISVWDLLWTLLLGFGFGEKKTLASLRRCFKSNTGIQVVPSAFYNRFTPAFTALVREVLVKVMSERAAPTRQLRGRLAAFKDLLTMDATILKLHDLLAPIYPACNRSNTLPAAAKLNMILSVVGRGPRTILLIPEKSKQEQKVILGPWMKGSLFLFDLGYYSGVLFNNIQKEGGFFVSRMKRNMNPKVVSVLGPEELKGAVGKPLLEVLLSLRGDVFDGQCEIQYRWQEGGRAHGAKALYRVVAHRHPEDGEWRAYITNIAPDVLTAEELRKVYEIRWEIEIVFRAMKVNFRLEQFPSKKAHVIEALIYAAILTLMVSRAFLFQLRRRSIGKTDRIPHERWNVVFAELAPSLLEELLAGRRGMKRRRRERARTMLDEAVDPNLKRLGGLLRTMEGIA